MRAIPRKLSIALLAVAAGLGTVSAEMVGVVAPDFALRGVNGKNYRLSEYRGQVVLISFWASWCGECRSQLEELAELHERYAGAGLQMLAIGLDPEFDHARDTVQSLGLGFPALHDADGSVSREYDVGRVPYAVLIDQDGIVRQEFAGFARDEPGRYLDEARALLNE
jgi:peroxiredoxin